MTVAVKRNEPYAKLFASFWYHKRTGPLTILGKGVLMSSISFCVLSRSDGLVPKKQLASIVGGTTSKRLLTLGVDELVEAGVFIDEGDGWRIRDFLEANISRSEDDERREQARGRQQKRRTSHGETDDVHSLSRVTSDSVTRESRVTSESVSDYDYDYEYDSNSGEREIASETSTASRSDLEPSRDTNRTEPDVQRLSRVTSDVEATASRVTPDVQDRDIESKAPAAHVVEVFEHWRKVMKKTANAKLDGTRRRRIEWAIRTYGIEDAKRAIDGCSKSSFHMGLDPKTNGKRYDDVELIFRNAKNFEGFLNQRDDSHLRGFAPPSTEWDDVDPETVPVFSRFDYMPAAPGGAE